MLPIITPKYDIGFKVHNIDFNLMMALEPWCSNLYCDISDKELYIKSEQNNTTDDLDKKIKDLGSDITNDVIVEFDATELDNEKFNFIVNIGQIIKTSGESPEGTEKQVKMKAGMFEVTIRNLKSYEEELINAI